MQHFEWEPVIAAPCHFVPPDEESAHTLADVEVDAAECWPPRSVTEVVRPAAQSSVQRVAHVLPRFVVTRYQQLTHLRLEPLHALLGRARAHIPLAVPPVGIVRSERVAKEIEALLSGIPQRGLGLVDCQPELGHHRLCPRQRLGRTTAAEDDEVVGIGDDMGTERLAASAATPVLEEPVHIDVGEQRARDTALRRAASVTLAATDPPLPVAIPLLDRRLEPHLDEGQNVPIDDAPGYTLHEIPVRN